MEEECPLIKALLRDPMMSREFLENHAKLPLLVRAALWLVSVLDG